MRAVVAFVIVAYAAAWLIALPLWLGDGLASPWFRVVSVAMMAAPTITALVAMLTVDQPRSIPRRLGIWPLKPVGRLLGFLVLAALPSRPPSGSTRRTSSTSPRSASSPRRSCVLRA